MVIVQPAPAAVPTAAASEAQDPKDYLYYKSGGAKWVTSADGKRRAIKRQHWECVRKDDGCQARKVTDHNAGSSNLYVNTVRGHHTAILRHLAKEPIVHLLACECTRASSPYTQLRRVV